MLWIWSIGVKESPLWNDLGVKADGSEKLANFEKKRAFQEDRTREARPLTQQCFWCVCGTAKRLEGWEQSKWCRMVVRMVRSCRALYAIERRLEDIVNVMKNYCKVLSRVTKQPASILDHHFCLLCMEWTTLGPHRREGLKSPARKFKQDAKKNLAVKENQHFPT